MNQLLETVGEFVSRKAWDGQGWGGVLRSLAGQMERPELLLCGLAGGEKARGEPTPLNPRGDDELRTLTRLAALCLGELPTGHRSRPPLRVLGDAIGSRLLALVFRTGSDHVQLVLPAISAVASARRHSVAAGSNALAESLLGELTLAIFEPGAEHLWRRYIAAELLVLVGPKAGAGLLGEALDMLCDVVCLERCEEESRGRGVNTLGALVPYVDLPRRRKAIEAACELLEPGRSDDWVCGRAANALGAAAPHADASWLTPVVAKLISAAESRELGEWSRRSAVEALGVAASFADMVLLPAVMNVLTHCVCGTNPIVWHPAAEALGRVVARAEAEHIAGTAEILCGFLISRDNFEFSRESAVRGLGRIARHADRIVQALVCDVLRAAAAPDEPSARVRTAAAEELQMLVARIQARGAPVT